jgi:hypothetical protein
MIDALIKCVRRVPKCVAVSVSSCKFSIGVRIEEYIMKPQKVYRLATVRPSLGATFTGMRTTEGGASRQLEFRLATCV